MTEPNLELFNAIAKRINPSPWQQKVICELIEEYSPWHTGTPTEEGDYLVKTDVEHNDYPYYVLKWYKGGWYSAFDLTYPACPQHSVLKWQKIEDEASKEK